MNILGFEISKSSVTNAVKPVVKDSALLTSTRFLLVLGFIAAAWFAKGVLTDPVLIVTSGAVIITYLIVNSWTKVKIAQMNVDYHTCAKCGEETEKDKKPDTFERND